MHVIEEKAAVVAGLLVKKHGFSAQDVGAGEFLQFLMDLLKELLPKLLECFTRESAAAAMRNPTFFQEALLGRFLARQLRGDRGFERKLLNPLKSSFVAMGKACTEDECKAALDEVESD